MSSHSQKTPEQAVRAWARLVRTSQNLMAHVEDRLKSAGLPPLTWYDILLEIRRAGVNGMRPAELEAELLIAQYNMSRILARIEKQELIARIADPDDGRAHRLRLTSQGARLLEKMWPVYDHALSETVAARLTSADMTALSNILAKLEPAKNT